MSSYHAKTWDSASSSFVYTKPKPDGNYGEVMLHVLDDLKRYRPGPLLVKVGGSFDTLHGSRTANQNMYPSDIFELGALRLVSGHNNSIESAATEEWCIRWWQDGTLT